VRDVVAMSPTVRALRGAPGVADVVVEDGGGDPLAGPLATARGIAWTGAAVFAGLALVIALAAVRIGLERSGREARVLALLGASPGFTALPSALAGALYGACAALVAALALGLVVYATRAPLAGIDLALAPATALGALAALGAVIGLIGGGLAGVARAR
jgi:cell division transport system permease protein